MNELYADIGWKSILHYGEQLCGDHVEIVETEDDLQIVVLADGLGSGVKASILSTLTSKIISTMMAQGMPLEECVKAIVDALPVDSQKGVAYSTFSIVCIRGSQEAELIQFDNPPIIFLRGCNQMRYPQTEMLIHGKKVFKSSIKLHEGDIFVVMSDGVTNASETRKYNYAWETKDIADYMKIFAPVGYTAKTLATMLVDECYRKYGEHPLDDATACVIRMRPRTVVNVMFGPPKEQAQDNAVIERFLEKPGIHVVCGGTTAKMVAEYLGKELKPVPNRTPTDIPPISTLAGLDLVTEGIVTLNRVKEYAEDNLGENDQYAVWSVGRDGASRLSRMLFEEASEVNFFVGQAVNPAHQSEQQKLIGFSVKMDIVNRLADALHEMGKKVTKELN